jgi:hypothetical protein
MQGLESRFLAVQKSLKNCIHSKDVLESKFEFLQDENNSLKRDLKLYMNALRDLDKKFKESEFKNKQYEENEKRVKIRLLETQIEHLKALMRPREEHANQLYSDSVRDLEAELYNIVNYPKRHPHRIGYRGD